MKYRNFSLGLGLVTAVIGILVWQRISSARTTSKSLIPPPEAVTGGTQQPAGQVSVEVNYLAGKSDENKIVFEVSLNTHSVDLDDIDFQKSVILEASGRKFSPVAVKTEGANHHRSAEVKFNRVSAPLKIIFLETPEVARQEFMFDELK
ncbi:hypothetical protein HZB78_03365 [Candidatus Collierbacteria bacterium]|nr:hypothetical protein [Candidatus Collierbacteria bacterium]